MIMKKTLSMFALASLILGLASCANEISGGLAGDENDLIIKFVVGGASEFDTKAGAGLKASGEQTDKILISEPGDPDEIFLVETVKNLDDVYFGSTPATKGTPVYTENFVKMYPSFTGVGYQYTSATATEISDCSGLTAFTGMASAEFGNIANSPITYAYNFGQKTWPENQSILFFLQAPSTINGLEEGSLAHKYVKAANANQGIDAYNGITEFELTTPADATEQQDILITSKSLRWEDYREKEATRSAVLFYHALAGVKFACSNLDDNITTITNVTLTNIREHGTCTVTPTFDQEGYILGTSNAAPQVTKSAGCVSWSDAADTDYADFVLNVPENVIMVGANNTAGLPSSFYGNGSGNKNLNNSDFEYTFFFIPQTTAQNGEDVELTISYLINGKGPEGTATVPFTRTVKFNGRAWQAGVLYTYTLSANHVDVSITDKLDESKKIKSDLVIKNTGNTDSYIRVAVIGNWYDNHSPAQIVCPWGTRDGNYNNFDWDETYWREGNDGYYYYKNIVMAGHTVQHPLFESYTVTAAPENYPDAHLEISLLVQAADANKLKAGMGWEMTGLTTTKE